MKLIKPITKLDKHSTLKDILSIKEIRKTIGVDQYTRLDENAYGSLYLDKIKKKIQEQDLTSTDNYFGILFHLKNSDFDASYIHMPDFSHWITVFPCNPHHVNQMAKTISKYSSIDVITLYEEGNFQIAETVIFRDGDIIDKSGPKGDIPYTLENKQDYQAIKNAEKIGPMLAEKLKNAASSLIGK